MSSADRISKARRNYSGIVPKTEADGVLAKFIQRITDGIQQTAEDELTAREYTNTGAKLKHPASQATLDKLKAEIIGPVNMSGGEEVNLVVIADVKKNEYVWAVPQPPRTQLDRIEDKLNEILKLLKKE